MFYDEEKSYFGFSYGNTIHYNLLANGLFLRAASKTFLRFTLLGNIVGVDADQHMFSPIKNHTGLQQNFQLAKYS